MLTRRRFIQNTGILGAALSVGYGAGAPGTGNSSDTRGIKQLEQNWFMPAESDPHKRTWMAFGASADIWGGDLLPEVRHNLATIARTISRYEPVYMLVREKEYHLARDMVGDGVHLVVSPLDDLWIRDTAPVFVITENGKKAAVNFNFNGWGNKQEHYHDANVADFVASQAQAMSLASSLVLEGGAIEVDGQGTAIITESCTLNSNRNPGISRAQFEDWLMPLLSLDKIIWLPGIKGMDITDGHTDFYARFSRPGTVLAGYEPDQASFDHEITKLHLEILKSATDARGNRLEVITLKAPASISQDYETDEFSAGYIGFYVCNGAVIMQEFGDGEADKAARVILQKSFPDRSIEQIKINAIAAGGGTIHCTTQQEPLT